MSALVFAHEPTDAAEQSHTVTRALGIAYPGVPPVAPLTGQANARWRARG